LEEKITGIKWIQKKRAYSNRENKESMNTTRGTRASRDCGTEVHMLVFRASESLGPEVRNGPVDGRKKLSCKHSDAGSRLQSPYSLFSPAQPPFHITPF
jgi:hypothetical protein